MSKPNPRPWGASSESTLADIKTELRGINDRLDGIDARLGGVEKAVCQNGMLLRAMARETLLAEVFEEASAGKEGQP